MLRLTALLLLLASSGCNSLMELRTTSVLHVKTAVAWSESTDMPQTSGHYRHFARGWKRGYFDVSDGRSGATPAVPPKRYWAPRYKTEQGRASVAAWYEGYEQGAFAAKQACQDQLNDVPSEMEYYSIPYEGAYNGEFGDETEYEPEHAEAIPLEQRPLSSVEEVGSDVAAALESEDDLQESDEPELPSTPIVESSRSQFFNAEPAPLPPESDEAGLVQEASYAEEVEEEEIEDVE